MSAELPPLSYSVSGSGRPIILLHGLGSNAGSWGRVIPRLAERYKVYAVDYYGHGQTPPVFPVNVATISAGLERFIQENRIQSPIIIGHSLGGSAAILFAEEHPEIPAAVVVVDGLPFLDVSEQRRKMLLSAFDSDADGFIRWYWGGMTLKAERVDLLIKDAKAADRRTLRTLYEESLKMDLRNDLSRITVPLLLVTSDGRHLGEMYRGTRDFTHITMKDTGHFIMLDKPEGLAENIMNWLHERMQEQKAE